MITTTGRRPIVQKKKGVYHLSHAFADHVAAAADVSVNRTSAKMGFHRALRLAGCKDGDKVNLDGTEIVWRYPTEEYEAKNWPSGFAKWNSIIDGIKGIKSLETTDPIWDIGKAEVARRAADLVPGIVKILTA